MNTVLSHNKCHPKPMVITTEAASVKSGPLQRRIDILFNTEWCIMMHQLTVIVVSRSRTLDPTMKVRISESRLVPIHKIRKVRVLSRSPKYPDKTRSPRSELRLFLGTPLLMACHMYIEPARLSRSRRCVRAKRSKIRPSS